MSINFPTSLDSFANPISTDLLENATTALDHDVQHSNANDAIEALEAKVGINGSAVTTSHSYKLGEITATDKAVGKTATQTLTNKTLTSPQINFGSDGTGDMMYRTSGGVTARLAIGTSGQILSVSGSGIPEWIANPSAADASTTVKGVVQEATQAQADAGTATGDTGARLYVNPSTLRQVSFFGDGSDGDVTISGNTTIARDMYYNNLTVNVGVSLTTANFRIFVKGTLTLNGTIENNGKPGGAGSQGSDIAVGGYASGGSAAGAAGAAVAAGTLPAILAGLIGGIGGTGGNGTSGSAGSNGTAVTYASSITAASNGAVGGVGAAGVGFAGTGGAAGTGSTPSILFKVASPYINEYVGTTAVSTGGVAGSGGGGSAAGSNSALNGHGGGGGGGGSGSHGGHVFIVANIVTISATGAITATGGAGGTGGRGGNATGGTFRYGGGGGAGGAGGNGGKVNLYYRSLTNGGAITAAGGALGAGGVGGTGADGTGTAGASASAGAAGVTQTIQI